MACGATNWCRIGAYQIMQANVCVCWMLMPTFDWGLEWGRSMHHQPMYSATVQSDVLVCAAKHGPKRYVFLPLHQALIPCGYTPSSSKNSDCQWTHIHSYHHYLSNAKAASPLWLFKIVELTCRSKKKRVEMNVFNDTSSSSSTSNEIITYNLCF